MLEPSRGKGDFVGSWSRSKCQSLGWRGHPGTGGPVQVTEISRGSLPYDGKVHAGDGNMLGG